MFDVHARNWTRVLAPPWLLPRIEHDMVFLNQSSLLLVAGGGETSYLDDTTFINLGCNAGSSAYDFAQSTCAPCPVGTYADQAGMLSCSNTCADKVTTHHVGATSASDCSVCAEDACYGHGHCTVDSDHLHQCQCHWGYTMSKDCQDPIEIFILGGVAFVVLIVALSWRRIVRTLRRLRRDRHHMYSLMEQLEERDEEIQSMSRDWLINSNELSLKHRIDKGSEGTYAEVYLALWQSEPVAVKRLRDQIQVRLPLHLMSLQLNSLPRPCPSSTPRWQPTLSVRSASFVAPDTGTTTSCWALVTLISLCP